MNAATIAITADTLRLLAGDGVLTLSADQIRQRVGRLESTETEAGDASARLQSVIVPPVGSASGFSSLAGEFIERASSFANEHARDLGDSARAVEVFCDRVEESDHL